MARAKKPDGYLKWVEWINTGFDNGWLSEPFCYVHGGPELSEEEEDLLEEEGDMDALCFPVARIHEYFDQEWKAIVAHQLKEEG